MADAGVPTMADAQRAADALMAHGAERVLMFGSLAKGRPRERSDIDLVAVLADLDYRSRGSVHERLRSAAREASGASVDVIVTDRAEWRIQCEQVRGSFANAIAGDLMLLAEDSPPPESLAATRWDKEQLMASTDEELAAEGLANAARMLSALRDLTLPGRTENALADTDPAEQADAREARLISACSTAHMAIENSLKAVGTIAQIAPALLWEHDVGKLADAVAEAAPPDGAALAALLDSAPELVRAPNYITMWRTVGVYGTPSDGMTAAEVATPRFAAALTVMAADVAEAAVRWLDARGVNAPEAEAIQRRARDIRDIAAHHDLGTGEPLDPAP